MGNAYQNHCLEMEIVDDGEMGEANLNCIEYVFDDTDCPVGILEFGNIAYSDGQGS